MGAIRFIQTKPLSPSCLLPCPLPPFVSVGGKPAMLSVYVPYVGSLRPGGNITLKGGCGDCSVSIDLFAKINPYLMALGLPLCVLGCAGSLVTLVLDTTGVVTGLAKVPPEPPTPETLEKIALDTAAVTQDCRCVLDTLLPSGICLYIKFVRDLLRLVAALIRCFTSLLGDIIRVSLTADIMQLSGVVRVRSHGICLAQLVRNQLDNANLSFDVIWAILLVTESIFKLAGAIPGDPLGGVFDAMALAIADFRAKAAGRVTADVSQTIPDATNLKNDLNDVAAALDAVSQPLTLVVDALCP